MMKPEEVTEFRDEITVNRRRYKLAELVVGNIFTGQIFSMRII